MKLMKQMEERKQRENLDFKEKQGLQEIADRAMAEEKQRRNETPEETAARQLKERNKRENLISNLRPHYSKRNGQRATVLDTK